MYAQPICSCPTDSRTNFFSPSIRASSRNLFILGDFNCYHSLWDSRGTSDPRGEEVFNWVISSMTLTHPFFSIAPLAVALLLTSPLLPPLLPYLVSGKRYRTWVLTIYQFFYLSLSLRSIAKRASPFLQFSESSLG